MKKKQRGRQIFREHPVGNNPRGLRAYQLGKAEFFFIRPFQVRRKKGVGQNQIAAGSKKKSDSTLDIITNR